MNQNSGGANRSEDGPPVQRVSTWPVQETGTRTENLRPTHQRTTRETNEVNLTSVPFRIVLVIGLFTFTGGLGLGVYVGYGSGKETCRDVITESAVCKVELKNGNNRAEEAKRERKRLEQQLQNARQTGQEDNQNLAVCRVRVEYREKDAERSKEQYQEEKRNLRECKTELNMLYRRYDEEKQAHSQHKTKLEVCEERLQSSGKDLTEAKEESFELRAKLQGYAERLHSSTSNNLKEEKLIYAAYELGRLQSQTLMATEQPQSLIKPLEETNSNLSTRADRVPPIKHKANTQCDSKTQSAFNATET